MFRNSLCRNHKALTAFVLNSRHILTLCCFLYTDEWVKDFDMEDIEPPTNEK